MPGIRAGIGRFAGDMFAAVGSITPSGRRATTAAMAAASRATVPHALSPSAMRTALRPQHMKSGKKAIGYGVIGASGINMLASNRSTGAYSPAPRPMTSAPPGLGRLA